MTFVLAAPFYALNALAYLDVLGRPALGPVYIALFTFTPVAAAAVLTLASRGREGVKQLLWRILDFDRIAGRRWYVIVILMPLLIGGLSLGGTVLIGAEPAPAAMPFAALPLLVAFFFVLAAGEETGWMGYAFEPMQARLGAFRAGLLLGVIWAAWHLPFFVFMMPDVIAFQFATLVGTRVLIAWVYNNAGNSVFATIVFHAVSNAVLITLPNAAHSGVSGSAISCGVVLSAAVAVTLLWGPRTLARYRFS